MLQQMMNPKDIEEHAKALSEPDWLIRKRITALEQFPSLPAPLFRYGITISVRATGLDLDAIEYSQALENGTTITVLEQQELQGAIVADFKTAMKSHEKIIQEHLFSVLGKPAHKIAAIHQALCINPMLIYVPKGIHVSLPILLKTQVRAGVRSDHLLVIAEENSKVTIVEETESHPQHPDNALYTKGVEIIAKDNAEVNYINIQNLGQQAFHFTKKAAVVRRQGKVNWLDCTLGGKLAHVEVRTSLDGEGAQSNNWGMFFGENGQQFDLASTVRHTAPHTTANMLTKGAVTDRAKAIYRGLIKMERQATQANGFQRADTLLLSEDAEADNIPALEIDNADVKCSHASTIGQMDEEKMFYLRSRGLTEKEAQQAIVRGFFEQLIVTIPAEHFRAIIRKIVEERI